MAAPKKTSIPTASTPFERSVKQVLEVHAGRLGGKVKPLLRIGAAPTADDHNDLVDKVNELIERLQD